jgi:hypothetical protein
MKFSRLFILAAALMLLCGLSGQVAKANTVDPRAGTGGGGSCDGPLSFGSAGLSQTYSALPTTSNEVADSNHNCVIDFVNNTGFDVTSLTVTILTPFLGEGSVGSGMTDGSLSCAVYAGAFGFGSPSPFNNAVKTDNNACTYNDVVVIGSWLPGTTLGLALGVDPTVLGFFQAQCSDPAGCANLNSLDVRFDATSAVPEPATMVLIGTGLVALVGRKKLKARQLA